MRRRNRFKKYDIGDIVGVEGEVFRTQRGEMSVRAKKITLLSKSLRPLPEKYHGLIELAGGELGVMLGVHTLVAEDAADLVHTLHAADDQAL